MDKAIIAVARKFLNTVFYTIKNDCMPEDFPMSQLNLAINNRRRRVAHRQQYRVLRFQFLPLAEFVSVEVPEGIKAFLFVSVFRYGMKYWVQAFDLHD